MRTIWILFLCSLLCACATVGKGSELRSSGVIISKVSNGFFKQIHGVGNDAPVYGLSPQAGALGIVVTVALEAAIKSSSWAEKWGLVERVELYAFVVRLIDGRLVGVISQADAFPVGECVVVFEYPGARNDPKMAFGGDCPASAK